MAEAIDEGPFQNILEIPTTFNGWFIEIVCTLFAQKNWRLYLKGDETDRLSTSNFVQFRDSRGWQAVANVGAIDHDTGDLKLCPPQAGEPDVECTTIVNNDPVGFTELAGKITGDPECGGAPVDDLSDVLEVRLIDTDGSTVLQTWDCTVLCNCQVTQNRSEAHNLVDPD